MWIGAMVGVVCGLASAVYNSTFQGAYFSAEWIVLGIGYFSVWALVGGVIGRYSSKRKQAAYKERHGDDVRQQQQSFGGSF